MNHDNASLLRRQPKGRRQSLGNGNTKVKYQLTINRRKTNLYVYLVLAIILHARPGYFQRQIECVVRFNHSYCAL